MGLKMWKANGALGLALALILSACGAASETPSAEPQTPIATSGATEPEQPSEQPSEAPPTADASEFYEGNTVRIVVGFSPGGGFDTYARVIAAHLGNHIPGNPQVIVENMPGAGSLAAANALYNTLPQDGSTMAHFLGELFLLQALDYEPAEFDATQFGIVGIPTPETPVCAVRSDTGVTRLSELEDRAEPLVFGGQAPGTNTDDPPNILREALGLNMEIVTGYPGTADLRLAVEQGELDGICFGWEAMRVTWAEQLEAGDVVPIGHSGEEEHPELEGVELFRELAGDDEARQMIELGIDAPAVFQRIFAVPPNVPEERLAALQSAFEATMNDPDFLAEAEEAGLAISYISPDRAKPLIEELLELPEGIKERMAPIILPES